MAFKCLDCEFYNSEVSKSKEYEGWGRCHRYAPKPGDSVGMGEWEWPVVMQGDWCGEYTVDHFVRQENEEYYNYGHDQ